MRHLSATWRFFSSDLHVAIAEDLSYKTMHRLVFGKPVPVLGDGFFYANFTMLRYGDIYYGEDIMARASKKPTDNKPRGYATELKPVAWLKVDLPDGVAAEIAQHETKPQGLFMQVCVFCLERWDISVKLNTETGKVTAFAFRQDPVNSQQQLGISAGAFTRFGALYALCVKISTVGEAYADFIVDRVDNPVW
jgi:hypothetical protein